jgi:hypothetical protein
MTQQSEVSDELQKFIRSEIGIFEKRPVLASDVIEDDYGSTGDDADQFMEEFFRHFSIERGDYDFHRYFEIEGSGPIIPFFGKWYMRKVLKIPEYVREPLTVSMLQRAIELGAWDSQRLRE